MHCVPYTREAALLSDWMNERKHELGKHSTEGTAHGEFIWIHPMMNFAADPGLSTILWYCFGVFLKGVDRQAEIFDLAVRTQTKRGFFFLFS